MGLLPGAWARCPVHRVWPAIGYIILCLALGYVGYLASDVFATQEANGITTAQALARLGMDSATWIIQRSLLAVVLVFLSGFLRYVAPLKTTATAEDIAAQTEQERLRIEAELKLEPLRERLQAQKMRGASETAAAARGVASALFTGRAAPKITPPSQPFELSSSDRSNSPVTIALDDPDDDPDEEDSPPDFDPDPAPNPPGGIDPASPGADWPDADRSNVRAYPANSRRAVFASASVHRSSNPAATPSDEGTEKPSKRGRKPRPARGDTGMSDDERESLRQARLSAARAILEKDPGISYDVLAKRIAIATQHTISASTAHSLAMEITGRRPKSRTSAAAERAATAASNQQ
jgi:hypothetical protein